jgi:hypothetical protein
MKKKCKIVILPADKEALIYRNKDGILYQVTNDTLSDSVLEYYHLYILSDDDIKENDWVYSSLTESIDILFIIDKKQGNPFKYKKIIATTNPTLKTVSTVSNEFIAEFCRKNQKNNVLSVMVNYQYLCANLKKCPTYPRHCHECSQSIIFAETDQNNILSTCSSKTAWTRDEIYSLFKKLKRELSSCDYECSEIFYNWIEENL